MLTIEDTLGENHVVAQRKSSPNIIVDLDFIQIKAISIKKGKTFKKKSYFRKIFEPSNKEKCFICVKKGHWANKCPNKLKKPRLVVMFSVDIDPSWWDLSWYEVGDWA